MPDKKQITSTKKKGNKILKIFGIIISAIIILVFLFIQLFHFTFGIYPWMLDKNNGLQPLSKNKEINVNEKTDQIKIAIFNKNKISAYDIEGNFIENIYEQKDNNQNLLDAYYCQKENKVASVLAYNKNDKQILEVSILDLKSGKKNLVDSIYLEKDDDPSGGYVSFNSDCKLLSYKMSSYNNYSNTPNKIYDLNLNKIVSLAREKELVSIFWSPLEDYFILSKAIISNEQFEGENREYISNYSFSVTTKNQLLEKIKSTQNILNLQKYDLSKINNLEKNINIITPVDFIDENNLILGFEKDGIIIPGGLLNIKNNKFTPIEVNELGKKMGVTCDNPSAFSPCGYDIYIPNLKNSEIRLYELSGHFEIQINRNSKAKILYSIFGSFAGWIY